MTSPYRSSPHSTPKTCSASGQEVIFSDNEMQKRNFFCPTCERRLRVPVKVRIRNALETLRLYGQLIPNVRKKEGLFAGEVLGKVPSHIEKPYGKDDD
jgi:hypothetical protein